MGGSIRVKLVIVFGFVFVVMGAAAGLTVLTANSVKGNVNSVVDNYLPARGFIGELRLGIIEYQRDQFACLLALDRNARADAITQMEKHSGEVGAAFDKLAALPMSPAARADYDEARSAWTRYLSQTANLTAAGEAGSTESLAAALLSGEPAATMASINATADHWTDLLSAESSKAASDAGALLRMLPLVVLAGCAVVIIVGSMFASFTSRSIVRGVGDVLSTLGSLADNCAARLESGLAAFAANDLTIAANPGTKPIERIGHDEIGQMAVSTNALLARLHATMRSYEQARQNLSRALAEVHDAAQAVAKTTLEVNSSAVQSGLGSVQIAQTIGQVSAGASDQARAASETSDAVTDLRTVIEQVRGGAAETARSVEAQARAVDEMSRSIRTASRASADVHGLGGAAGEAAANGAATVRQTVEGMNRIKAAVNTTAAKVADLGAKGHQIGAIVETIDDIAEQTNLLALNAAIEAARAGEQGKGFAVVADEVRKLAERSSRATKEIAALIGEVQRGTEEAVKAMQIGASEVESGAELAEKSGAALEEIASAVGSSNAAVARIVQAMDATQTASAGLVSASDAIAAIAQETNAAAEAMTGSSEQVAHAVESIAAISEENSASAEEVSAATQEMSAQAHEVVASAGTLSEMATRLENLAARFHLAAETAEGDRPGPDPAA
jgi:methyl-accepting chemotaxis protein